MLFKEIIGQKDMKSRLINTVKNNRISHAQLFIGPKGSGKLAVAIAYAQYINCENPKDNDSCGECPSCIKYNKYIHPDLHFVFPVIKSGNTKPISDSYINLWREKVTENPYLTYNFWLQSIGTENKQASIYTDESDEIIKKLSFKTFEAKYKVMIIWLPEKMNNTASNKLLKVLEEPYPKTLFLLISDDYEKIIKTILSRTQLVKFPKIDNVSIKEELAKKYDIPSVELNDIVRLANGSYFRAIEALETSDDRKYNFEQFVKFMRLAFSKKVVELSDFVDDISKIGREKQKGFLIYMSGMMRENLILNLNQIELSYLNNEEQQFSEKFSKYITLNNIELINSEIKNTHYHIERNGNAKIVFMDFSIKMITFLHKANL